MTRTDALKRAINELLEDRRLEIDSGIVSIVITAKYHHGTNGIEPSDMWDTIQRERRRRPRTN